MGPAVDVALASGGEPPGVELLGTETRAGGTSLEPEGTPPGRVPGRAREEPLEPEELAAPEVMKVISHTHDGVLTGDFRSYLQDDGAAHRPQMSPED